MYSLLYTRTRRLSTKIAKFCTNFKNICKKCRETVKIPPKTPKICIVTKENLQKSKRNSEKGYSSPCRLDFRRPAWYNGEKRKGDFSVLPEAFLSRMQRLLSPEDYAAYLAAADAPPVRALRVNSLKTSPEAFLSVPPFPVTPLAFLSEGFLFDCERPGAHPLHHAGAYYVQDPSAQATVAALPEISPDSRVLDLCAAPGGKSTAVASRLSEKGVLVSNELSPSRAKALVGNLERMGVKNAIVLNTDAREIASLYENVFDLVLLDAPCSGEGMLRKYAVAGEEWSEENVLACARRQTDLLRAAAKTVAPGGCLVYSTCTFSPEENEYAVAAFLAAHPDFVLEELPPALIAVTRPGIPLDTLREKGFFPVGEEKYLPTPESIAFCRRFYPHVYPGEGQFIARLRRAPDAALAPVFGYRDARKPPTPADRCVVEEFLKNTLATSLPTAALSSDGERIYLFSPDFPLPPRHVFLSGVTVGEMKKGRLLPHHQFFSAYGSRFQNTLPLAADSPDVRAYLHGEEIAAPNTPDGFAAVLVDGIPVGGVKVSSGRAKNHYPKGLRTP